ncbi:hypothetical protein [Marinitoga litoralis]|jgi:hypothetical protein|uniref:hypothetical protein n=1 Tax=Marinitoga litoralis TaxID=570855 RepID=UPI0019613966|nr:hypothetical protein [Marinitoga litoralis]MBM7558276.1 hypothetical protein [Marinitoga litoralis]
MNININDIISYIQKSKENLSVDEIKRKYNISDQDWKIVFPFLLSNGIKINVFSDMDLRCSDCPINNFCDKKRCGG